MMGIKRGGIEMEAQRPLNAIMRYSATNPLLVIPYISLFLALTRRRLKEYDLRVIWTLLLAGGMNFAYNGVLLPSAHRRRYLNVFGVVSLSRCRYHTLIPESIL